MSETTPRTKSQRKSHSHRKSSHNKSPRHRSPSPNTENTKTQQNTFLQPEFQQNTFLQPEFNGNTELHSENLERDVSHIHEHPYLLPPASNLNQETQKNALHIHEHPNLLPSIDPEFNPLPFHQGPVNQEAEYPNSIQDFPELQNPSFNSDAFNPLATKDTTIHQGIHSNLEGDCNQRLEKLPNEYGLTDVAMNLPSEPQKKHEETTQKPFIQPRTPHHNQVYPKELEQKLKQQEQIIREKKLSGEQERYKMKDAQNVLKMLQIVLEGEIPGTEMINDVLLKAEEFLMKEAQATQADPDARQALEDIALLIGSTKQMARNKDLGDRLQRIAEETAKAIQAINQPGLTNSTRDSTQEVLNVVENWRPVFELLVSSREFRVMIVDTIHICKRILLRHRMDTLPQKAEIKFLEGKTASEITEKFTNDVKSSFQTPQGEVQVLVTDEEFDALYDDITFIIIKLSKTPSYKVGLEKLFNLLDILNRQLNTGSSYLYDSKVLLNAKRAQLETENLVASFAGREPLDNFIGSLKVLVHKINQDAKTKEYLHDLKNFILDTKTADKMDEVETKERLKRFSREGRDLVNQYAYADELNDFFDKSDKLVEGIKNDEFMSILRHHAGLVASDLSYVDRQGNVQLDMELLGKIRSVIGPTIAESLKYIPIPRIEENTIYRHFWVDNIVLCGYDIIPENIRIRIENDSNISMCDLTDQYSTRLIISFDKIRTELKNLDFFYCKKTFPQLTEHGKVTVRLPGEGASLNLIYELEQQSGSTIPKFNKGTANLQIHDFEVDFYKETLTHEILVPMITVLLKYQIQREIELSIEKNIGGLVNTLGEKMTAALIGFNRPFIQGMETMRRTVKASDVGSILDKRREVLV